ncbi:hypothetical protein Rs2_10143 [Raphanus sativus]|nr:hypothetical protein Rs2_10143 [Raphanus sativus]
MGMKLLNKKGWHTGSLRNIENVWKAEQKQLEELRLQIVQEKVRSEFRALQEQAGLVPRQERLEFLYDSGLALGKGSASGSGVSFQKEEQPLANAAEAGNGAREKSDPSAPGALPREQEALARIKNNPVKMALIRKSVEEKGKSKDKKKHQGKSSSRHHSGSEEDSGEENGRKSHHHRTSVDHDEHYERRRPDLDKESKSYSKHY